VYTTRTQKVVGKMCSYSLLLIAGVMWCRERRELENRPWLRIEVGPSDRPHFHTHTRWAQPLRWPRPHQAARLAALARRWWRDNRNVAYYYGHQSILNPNPNPNAWHWPWPMTLTFNPRRTRVMFRTHNRKFSRREYRNKRMNGQSDGRHRILYLLG